METPPSSSSDARPYGRRAFLAVTALGLTSLAWGRPAWHALGGAASPLTEALPASLVPSSGWRIYTVAASMPRFTPETWRLRVDGLVGSPQSFSYEQLARPSRVEQVSTFHCVTGLVGSERALGWGAPLDGPRSRPGAAGRTSGEFTSAEKPYVDTLTSDQARLRDVMLAYEMDGPPLPRVHGAPLRLVIRRCTATRT